jgi:rhodanese-related sulfurtransferase
MPSVQKGDCVLLDIRSAGEFHSGHIRYARLIPVEELEKRVSELDRDKKLVIYCRTGKRCIRALPVLAQDRIEEVMVLEGGIERWPGGLVTDHQER